MLRILRSAGMVKKAGSHRVWAEVDVEIKTVADFQTARDIMRDAFVELANQIELIAQLVHGLGIVENVPK